jgi:serine phosphatase RsbU (regulator of sigma subunit)
MIKFTVRLLSFLLLFLSLALQAQHSVYYIRNYSPKDYHGFNQVWDAAQDKNGLIYFATTSSISIFNGSTFEKVPVKSGSANRQIVIDSADGTIYVGAVGDFGLLERDSVNGKLHFKSLTAGLSQSQKAFADIWKVCILDGKVYFQASERIFICSHRKVASIIESPHSKSFALMFKSRGRLYVRQRNAGLVEIVGTGLVPVPGGERFATQRILGMMAWKAGADLVLTGDSGFFVMEPKLLFGRHSLFHPFTEKPDTFLTNHAVLGCHWVNDSCYAVFSRSGIGFFNREGRFIEKLNKASGLNDESVSEVFVDRQKNIWLENNDGISKIAYNTPLLVFTSQSGFRGNIEKMLRYNGRLYIGTSDGLFSESSLPGSFPNKLRFNRVEGFPVTEVWDLTILNESLLVSTSNGIFQVNGETVRLVNTTNTNRIIKTPKLDEFIAFEKSGISIIEFPKGKHAIVKRHYDQAGEDIIRVGPIQLNKHKPGDYEFWCEDRFNVLLHVHFNLADSLISINRYDTTNGLPLLQLYPVSWNDSIYFVSFDRAFRYISHLDKGPRSNCFSPAPDIFTRLLSGDLIGFNHPLDSRLFLESKNDLKSSFFSTNVNNQLLRARIPLYYCLNDIDDVQCGYPEENGITWLSDGTNIIRYNHKQSPPSDVPFTAVVQKVSIGKDSVIFYGADEINNTNHLPIAFSFNSIAFSFASPYFEFDRGAIFQYKLEGFDTAWYKAGKQLEKNYTNLPEGVYTFRVKMLSLLGRQSQEASYTFTIAAPWYRRPWAYLLYVLAFAASIALSVWLAVGRIRRQKEKLEHIVTLRTAEVLEQKNEVEKQKQIVEEHQKEMVDSITYAKRLQEAILPSLTLIHQHLPQSFVMYRPKDIVAGDFYWMHTEGDTIWIAAADCTGHGVPGALVSIVCSNAMNRAVKEFGLKDTGAILDKVTELVLETFEKGGHEIKDGMDISLLSINRTSRQVNWSGAHNPLWIVKDGNLTEIKANKQPIGKSEHSIPFSTHTFPMEDGMTLYLITDGYADQFGMQDKKLMKKKFKELVLSIQNQSIAEQGRFLNEHHDTWKGEMAQTDDVTVIGIMLELKEKM